MSSNVGSASVYEAGDQRNAPESEKNNADRFHEGKENSHKAGDSSMLASYEVTCLYAN
jgi:hypothetical protein